MSYGTIISFWRPSFLGEKIIELKLGRERVEVRERGILKVKREKEGEKERGKNIA